MKKKSFLDLKEVRQLIKLRKIDEAEKILHELKAEHPDDEYLDGTLFDLYLKKGTYDKAEKILDKILKNSPDNYFFLSRKGDLLLAMNKNREAIELFHNLYNTKKEPHVGWRLANEYYKLKKYD
jgi:predicted Zn-dependent protease